MALRLFTSLLGVSSADYVCKSPIASTCGVKHTDDPKQLAHWQKLGELLSERLDHPAGNAADDQQRYNCMHHSSPDKY